MHMTRKKKIINFCLVNKCNERNVEILGDEANVTDKTNTYFILFRVLAIKCVSGEPQDSENGFGRKRVNSILNDNNYCVLF